MTAEGENAIDLPGRIDADGNDALGPAELAAEASLLDDRRSRLAGIWAGLREANDAYSAAIEAANGRFSATAGPLAKERDELQAAIARSEAAAAELAARRQRVEDLRRQLEDAESELPERGP